MLFGRCHTRIQTLKAQTSNVVDDAVPLRRENVQLEWRTSPNGQGFNPPNGYKNQDYHYVLKRPMTNPHFDAIEGLGAKWAKVT